MNRLSWNGKSILFTSILAGSLSPLAAQSALVAPPAASTLSMTEQPQPAVIDRDMTGITRYSNGYFINADPRNAGVHLRDGFGKLIGQFTANLGPSETGTTFFLRDAAAITDGTLVITAGAALANGAYENFLVHADQNGKVLSLLRTGTYSAQHLCVTPDNAIWTFGHDEQSDEAGNFSYDMLRNYSLNSGLVQSAVKRSTFTRHTFAYQTVNFHMACSATRVGVYAGTNEWIQYTPATGRLGRWKVDTSTFPRNFMLVGFAYLPMGAGHVYATVQGRTQDGRDANPGTLFELAYSQADDKLHWEPVAGTIPPAGKEYGTIAQLYGSDDNKLVYDGPMRQLRWAQPVFRTTTTAAAP
ncbi:MAG: hypothetical protein ABSA39_15185 [Edaphobacter sp.]